MDPMQLRRALKAMSAYREIATQPVMIHVVDMLDAIHQKQGEQALGAYTALLHTLWDAGFSSLGDWLQQQLEYTPSPYATLVEGGRINPALERAAHRDIETLALLAQTDAQVYLAAMHPLLGDDYGDVLSALPRWSASTPFTFDRLTAHYQQHGAGLYAQYRAFLWENGILVPVADPDCPKPEDLLGYELQRDQVHTNTRLLLSGRPANNVLLFGDGGTGKSATVKSMLYLPGMEALRLIEVQKENLIGLPQLMRSLTHLRQKFILFIDDLAFDQDDKTYSSLKTILEGSLEKRPANVVIYATSNRRHLVRQTFSDRAGDEVDTFETISEKTALAERFGLRIPYLTMNKAGYLALVDHLATQGGISMEREVLHAKAMAWEVRHAGRTPRVARQLIASLSQGLS